ncbi:MAG TPA: YihY/virulence factor BrkB family protein [Tahibacter sp.]|uniref:YihY/virulence factor BrkB family protein n=1 Tax=Tahibacter sp. TaxID=2056211 RepID=UPI002CCC2605|nr:YihY/virulence factor BrkB family protein [Tahibacter sp.]HSX60634.1 YihY/virulence factor BrkB family protein [Tahibacter sp.]
MPTRKAGDDSAKPLRLADAASALWRADPLTLAASIAFYTALSFAPIVVLSLAVAAQAWPGSEMRLVDQLGALLGSQVRDVAKLVVDSGRTQRFVFSASGVISFGALLVSASTALAQLQDAINRIWRIDAPGASTSAVRAWIRRRLLSLGMIAVIGFFLVVTLVVSTLLGAALTREGWAWIVVNEAATLAVFALAFAALFRFVPDERERWSAVLSGGFATAVLFDAGKWLLGAYLANSDQADAYGASGSVVLLLVWVYYSSLIVLVGAGLTSWVADRAPRRRRAIA